MELGVGEASARVGTPGTAALGSPQAPGAGCCRCKNTPARAGQTRLGTGAQRWGVPWCPGWLSDLAAPALGLRISKIRAAG